MYPMPGQSRELRQVRHDVAQLRFDLDRMGDVAVELFPALVSHGQNGEHAWQEQTFNSDGTRRTLTNAKFGEVAGLNGATVTRNPARMPDGSTLAGLPAEVWLKKTITTNDTLANYEVITAGGDTVEIVELYSSGATPPAGYLDARIRRLNLTTDTLDVGESIWLFDATA